VRVAVYGGAFNPPHVGHAMVVSWILMTGAADRVILVPAADHPFGKKMAPFATRLAYCQAFAQDIDPGAGRVSWDECEAELPTPNYSINLLRHIRAKCPGDKLRFVMGADNLARRADWFGFDDIVREFDPIFVNRAGVVLPEGVEVLSPVFPDVSSTDVRGRLEAGLPVSHLVSQGVLKLLR
jgi:nicotinate-nucleotide adenylyltransferase